MQVEQNNLFVGNISFDIDQDKLRSIFEEIEGVEVLEASLIMNRETNSPRGFGFVKVKTDEMAEKCVNELNGKEILGRNIVVNIAKPREERPRTGGGQGGYSGGRRY
ncbi:MAG: RNA-binding protein [bacterium]